ncbi:MAG: L-seryl-tRNA(Sec) selenium transferase, partial [Desulfobacterales bacterium]|nr:L-seryl-tRNA(Sec) selenium transferase [Desulfobacterales bacterium]
KSGGGSLPLLDLPTTCIRVKVAKISANAIEKMMRRYDPPVIGRIEDDSFLLDIRTVQEDEISTIVTAFEKLLQEIVP